MGVLGFRILLCSFAAFFGALTGSPAWALQGSGGSVGGVLPWADEKEFEECDQVCLYKRANENLSLQVGYVIHKTDKIKALLDAGKDAEALSLMGPFCAQKEDPTKCFNRWKILNTTQLHRMRGSMMRNSNQTVMLKSDLTAAGVATKAGAPSLSKMIDQEKAIDTEKRPNVTYVPTFEELQRALAQESLRLEQYSAVDYRNQLQSLMQEPDPNDFPKFKSIPKNPEKRDPGENYLVAVYKPDGTLDIDTKAYDAAVALYKSAKVKDFIKDESKNLQDPNGTKARADAVKSATKAFLKRPKASPSAQPAPGSDEEVFAEARQPLVDMANDLIEKKKIEVENPGFAIKSQVNFGDKNKAPDPVVGGDRKQPQTVAPKSKAGPSTFNTIAGSSVDQSTVLTNTNAAAGAKPTEVKVPKKQSQKNRKPGEETFNQISTGYSPKGGRLQEGEGTAEDIDQYMAPQ